jgi:SAM-dependent methyltransferase
MTEDGANQAIDYFSIGHPLRSLATSVAMSARRRMYERFCQLVQPTEETTVIDVGVTPDQNLADSNFFERFYPYPHRLTATSIEDASFLAKQYPGLKFVKTDGKTLPFEDRSFDVAVSLAVIEHVGTRESQRQFVAELLRVSKRIFLTTPDRSFPVEVHTFLPFIHWLPQRQHQWCLSKLGLRFWADIQNLNLLTRKDLSALFPASAKVRIFSHHTCGLSSNLIAVAGDI